MFGFSNIDTLMFGFSSVVLATILFKKPLLNNCGSENGIV